MFDAQGHRKHKKTYLIRSRFLAVIGSMVLALGLMTPAVAFDGGVDDFYAIDNVDPHIPGEILRTQTTTYNRMLGEADFALPKTVDKIMYTTTDQTGSTVPVTGYVVEPQVPWNGPGRRPTVVVGRGTVGQGDKCAPSRQWPLDGQPSPLDTGRKVNFEALYDWVYANQGVRVVVTDYIGMGTSIMHTYMNRLDQAYAMIDAARAVKNLVGEDNFGQVAFYGHSQGGGASAAAVEEVSNYAPELDVAGAYASAPPANLEEVQRGIEDSALVGALGFSINGLAIRYPEVNKLIEDRFSDAGKQVLKDAADMCTDEVEAAFGDQQSRDWTNTGEFLNDIIKSSTGALKAMEDQRIGNGVNQAPTMIISGPHDGTVSYQQSKELATRWCTAGGQVVYRDDVMPEITGYNHFIQALSGGVFGVDFLMNRFRGKPLPATCQISETPQGSLNALSSIGSIPRVSDESG